MDVFFSTPVNTNRCFRARVSNLAPRVCKLLPQWPPKVGHSPSRAHTPVYALYSAEVELYSRGCAARRPLLLIVCAH